MVSVNGSKRHLNQSTDRHGTHAPCHDVLGDGEEGLVHVDLLLGRGLEELDPVLLRQLLALLRRHALLLRRGELVG